MRPRKGEMCCRFGGLVEKCRGLDIDTGSGIRFGVHRVQPMATVAVATPRLRPMRHIGGVAVKLDSRPWM